MNSSLTSESREFTFEEKFSFLLYYYYRNSFGQTCTQSEAAKDFGGSDRTIRRLIKDYEDTLAEGKLVPDFRSRKEGLVGPKSKFTPEKEQVLRAINDENSGKRTLAWIAAEYLARTGNKIAPSTVRDYFREMGISRAYSYLKPMLTPQQRLQRLQFILSKLGNGKSFNLDPYRVHVDEKWFYVTRDKKLVWCDPNDPYDAETVQHKSHIAKVMFLVAVGLPQHYELNGTTRFFDGKIGLWHLTETQLAIKNSKNRPAGTEITVPVTMTAERYRTLMEEKVLPAIRKKMAFAKKMHIVVQHDGARPHTGKGNAIDLDKLGSGRGYDIVFDLQPAQSPDLNKLDLCFFHSLQRQAEAITHTKTVDGVMAAVDEAFQNYDPNQLKRVHALLFQAYRQILESEGGNQYKIFHTGIRDRLANGEDPWDLSVPKGLKKKAKEVVIRLQNELSLR